MAAADGGSAAPSPMNDAPEPPSIAASIGFEVPESQPPPRADSLAEAEMDAALLEAEAKAKAEKAAAASKVVAAEAEKKTAAEAKAAAAGKKAAAVGKALAAEAEAEAEAKSAAEAKAVSDKLMAEAERKAAAEAESLSKKLAAWVEPKAWANVAAEAKAVSEKLAAEAGANAAAEAEALVEAKAVSEATARAEAEMRTTTIAMDMTGDSVGFAGYSAAAESQNGESQSQNAMSLEYEPTQNNEPPAAEAVPSPVPPDVAPAAAEGKSELGAPAAVSATAEWTGQSARGTARNDLVRERRCLSLRFRCHLPFDDQDSCRCVRFGCQSTKD